MILKCSAVGVLEAQRSFRKVAGYRALPKLVADCESHDALIDRERRVDNGRKNSLNDYRAAAQIPQRKDIHIRTWFGVKKEIPDVHHSKSRRRWD